jgi:hypothetical protein
MDSMTKRTFLKGVALTPFFPTQLLAQEEEDFVYVVPDFEPSSSILRLKKEIIFCIDTSGSMDIESVNEAVRGVLVALEQSKLLSKDPKNAYCSGPIGVGFLKFSDKGSQLGYMVLHSTDDVLRAKEHIDYITPNRTHGNTSPAHGMLLAGEVLKHSPCRFSQTDERLVFVIGDQDQNTKGDPEDAVYKLALNQGATTHFIAMSDSVIYEGLPTIDGLTYPHPSYSYPVNVAPGTLTQAKTAPEIAAAIVKVTNPNCSVTHNKRFDSHFRYG